MPEAFQKIGHYDVIGKLGEGGMGVVYKGRDAAIGRQVAIKMMIGDFIKNAELRERFAREARAAGNLQHPNIVTIHELGEQEGAPYIVMEFLEGEPLDHIIAAQRPMLLANKLDIIIQVLDALEYAHQRGIVHRDIKPANVMVLNQGGIKLVDFGIARLGGQKLTRTGTVMGTINYMSPEQINGKTVDGRADVFSTGVMLFELISGSLPFEGEDTTQTMFKILTAPVPPLVEMLPECPPQVQAVLERALAKDRERRYRAAAEMEQDLVAVRQQLAAGAPMKTTRAATAAANGAFAPTVMQGNTQAPQPAMTMVQGSVAPAPAATMVQGSAAAAPTMVTTSQPISQLTAPAAIIASTPPVEKKKSSAGLIIATVLVVVLGGGGYFGYKKFASAPADAAQQVVTNTTTAGGTAAPAGTQSAANGREQVSAEEAFRKGDSLLREDPKQAAQWYEQAVAKNHPGAMAKLAKMYLFGSGVDANPTRAASLLQKAADLREPNAILDLARAYRDGSGVGKDTAAAYKWYTIAMNFDPAKSSAEGERSLIENSLSKDQIAGATRDAIAWLAAHK